MTHKPRFTLVEIPGGDYYSDFVLWEILNEKGVTVDTQYTLDEAIDRQLELEQEEDDASYKPTQHCTCCACCSCRCCDFGYSERES